MRSRWRAGGLAAGVAVVVAGAGACGYDWTVVAKTQPNKSGDASVKKEPPQSGGTCQTSEECASSEYCAFADLACGKGEAGRCTVRPPSFKCDQASRAQVCGCDGELHDSPCAANAAGTDLAAKGTCTAPPNSFLCGYAVCSVKTFCVATRDPKTGAGDYRCEPWTCTTRTCDCKDVDLACGGAACNVGAAGQVFVDCPK